MRQRAFLFILAGLAAFIGSILLSSPENEPKSVDKRYESWQNSYVNGFYENVSKLRRDSLFIASCMKDALNCKKYNDKPFSGIFRYDKNNELNYWSNPLLPAPSNLRKPTNKILWLDGSPYLASIIKDSDSSSLLFLSSPRKALSEIFSGNTDKAEISFQKKPSSHPFLNTDGKPMFFVKIDKYPPIQKSIWLAYLIYVLSLISLFFGCYFFVELIFSDYSERWRVIFTIIGFLIIRFLTSMLYYRGLDMDLYQTVPLSNFGSTNLEILWINILLFYSCLIVITAKLRFEITDVHKSWFKYLFHSIAYLAIIASCLLVAYVGREIIFSSSLGHTLATISDWNTGSFLSLIAFIVFMVAVFHLAWFLINTLSSLDFTLSNKLLSLVISCIVSLSIYSIVPLNIHPFPFYLIVILFILLMDLFVEEKHPSLNWLFIWVAIASACSTSVLYKYNVDKLDEKQRAILYSAAYSESIPNSQSQQEYIQPQKAEKNIDYAVYVNNKRQAYQGDYYPLVYPYDTTSEVNQILTLEHSNRYEFIYRPSDNVTITSSRIPDDIITPFSWYAYIFVIWVIITLALASLNTQWQFLPKDWNLKLTQLPSLRRRIQFNIMMITIGSFAAVCLLSYVYLRYTSIDQEEQEVKNKLSILADDVEKELRSIQNIGQAQLLKIIDSKAELHRAKANFYTDSGELLSTASPTDKTRMNFSDFNALKRGNTQYHLSEYKSDEVITPLMMSKNVMSGYLGLTLSENTTDIPFNTFLNTLLKLYIFLGVIALGIALVVSNSITGPLRKLGDKLKDFKLGKKNQRLEWNNPDELGELIHNYNSMIDELEASAEMMAEQQRDVAWREMAKQVAHEIKNPLTPMKLSIQHLKFAIENNPEKSKELVEQVSETLIEQIDNLTRIASGFSNFAKMPTPENQKLSLNNVVTNVHDLFRKRDDMNIELNVPINDIYVFADKDQMSRILTNLLKNAIQSIPTEKKGHIVIDLYSEDGNALISIQDNGTGIPDEMIDKVFKPNFTSKTSGTGLGLAICANMVEGFNGKIYFETEVDEGTTFYVEIPLMHDEENNKVYL